MALVCNPAALFAQKEGDWSPIPHKNPQVSLHEKFPNWECYLGPETSVLHRTAAVVEQSLEAGDHVRNTIR